MGASATDLLYLSTPAEDTNNIDLDSILQMVREAKGKVPAAEAKHLVKEKSTTNECLLRDGNIYVHKQALQIKVDLLVSGHCEQAGHRVQAVTRDHVKKHFTCRGITDELTTFVSKFLQCHDTAVDQETATSNTGKGSIPSCI